MSSIFLVGLVVLLAMGAIVTGSWFFSRGGRWSRLLGIGGLVLLGLFCGFGFLSTFEPLDAEEVWTWRVIYGGLGIACLAGGVVLARSLLTSAKGHPGS